VIGVTPPAFFGETVGSTPDLWLPIAFQPLFTPTGWLDAPSHSWLTLLGRLAPGRGPRSAEAALDPLYRELARLTPQRVASSHRVSVQPASRGIASLDQRVGQPLWILMGVTGLVLLLASCNLANLMLSRGAARTQEMGVRLALGAGRPRILRQLLTESLLLVGLGAIAALWFASAAARALTAWANADLSLGFDWRHLAFTGATALVAACVFALAPAWNNARVDLASVLQAGRRSSGGFHNRFGKTLIAVQLAISLTLLSAGAQLCRSLWSLRHQDFGYDAGHVVMAQLPLEFTRTMIERRTALRDPLLERMRSLPGIRSAAVSSFGVLDSIANTCGLSAPGHPSSPSEVTRRVHVSPRYFETMGIPIVAGRAIADTDRAESPRVAVLSETAARNTFGTSNPIGRFISPARSFEVKSALLVVGVARDVRFSAPRDPYGNLIYVPLAQIPAPVTAVVLRTSSSDVPVAANVRSALASLDSTLMVGAVESLEAVLDGHLAGERLLAGLSACFGILALAVTAIGAYGVVGYAVARRTQEIGIRLALGADRGAVVRMILAEVARVGMAGIALGTACAIAASGPLRAVLFAAGVADRWLLVAAAALLAAVVVLAAAIPARRATRLDPMLALRQE
jgi:predicted permease